MILAIVGNGAVLDVQDEHGGAGIPNLANNPIIPHPITPQPTLVMTQGFTEAPGVFRRGKMVIRVIEDFFLYSTIKGFQIFLHPWVVFNDPGQGSSAIHWN